MRSGRVALVVLGIGGWLALGLALAPPASASHVIEWGAGTDCAAVRREAAATVNEQVPFIACASIGGEPLAGWEMTLQVVGPTRSVEASIVAGDDGIARFAVQPTAAGTTTVTLCDPDGCLYGQTVLEVSEPAPAPTTTVPPAPAPTTTVVVAPTTTAPAPVVETSSTTTSTLASAPTTAGSQERPTTTTTVRSSRSATPASSSSSGFGLLWAFVVLLLLLFLAAAWRGMLAMPIGNPPIDPCADLRRRVAELSGLLADAIIRATETQKRRDEVRASIQRLRDAGAASGPTFDELESEEVMADAMDEQADAEVRRLRAELDAATAALRRCEGGEAPPPGTGTAGGTGTGPQPGSTPPPPEQPPPCCHSGQWIGFSVSCGGIVGPYGTDGGYIFLFCVGDLERKAIISFAGRRIGLGVGGAAQAGIFFIVRGPQHPSELQPVVERILAGVDFDVSVGASVTKLGEAAITGVRRADDVAELVRSVRTYMTQCRALKQARRRGDIEDAVAIQREFGEVLQRFGETNRLEDVVDKMVEATGKGGMSAGQAGGSGANVPLGIGLQVGVWNVDRVQTELVHVFGCAACSPGNH